MYQEAQKAQQAQQQQAANQAGSKKEEPKKGDTVKGEASDVKDDKNKK